MTTDERGRYSCTPQPLPTFAACLCLSMLAGLGWVARPSTSGITYLRARAHTLARYGKVTPQCSLVMEYHRELVAIYGQMRTCYEKRGWHMVSWSVCFPWTPLYDSSYDWQLFLVSKPIPQSQSQLNPKSGRTTGKGNIRWANPGHT